MLSSTYLFNIRLKLIKCRNVEVFLPAIMDTLKMYMTNRMFLFVSSVLQGVLHQRT